MRKKYGLWLVLAVAAEIAGIVVVADWIGAGSTFGLLLLGVVAGALLAQTEGRKAWMEAQRQFQSGGAPGHAMLNGLCILAGGLLLIIPGFLSDIVGLTLLLPFTRPLYKGWLYHWLERKFRSGSFRIYGGPMR
ncbi:MULTISPECIES: FxsA family protein [Cohnella]|uniref:FxsA family protein n=1 Tax=Cohnella TaxID=329857 RepID=UPI0009BC0965|nr:MULTISPECIES: FxsA family protein [Cohnella]MBN2982954.1 FxsA family protein [Cohnella algarum]